MANAINWFEIPANDFKRAKTFYSQIFDTELTEMEIMDTQMAMFNTAEEEVSGAICKGEGHVPSKHGTIPYLNGGQDLTEILERVDPAGGEVVFPKTKISDEVGYFAHFLDSEGNIIGLLSPN